MADAPLRPDEYAIYSVLFDEGPHTPTDLARRAGMPPTTMSHFVRAMLERGHAIREIDPRDRRSYRLALTPAGLAAHAAAGQAFHEADDRFMASLAIDEDTARASLAAIGDAAVVATDLLAAASMEATA
jgi:DNA-binding MarR family transcriptional regulator